MSQIACKVAETLQRSPKILIVTHMGPDYDAVGSMAGLAHICLALGKDIRLLCQTGIPEDLLWLRQPGTLVQEFGELHGWRPDLLVLADCATPARAGAEIEAFFAGERPKGWENVNTLSLDHHSDNPLFAELNWLEGEAAATAQLVGKLAVQLGFPLKGELGEAVYTGLVGDTGNFTYSNTSGEVMRMAADIVEQGLNIAGFTQKKDNTWALGRMKMWGELMQSLSSHAGGRVICTVISRALMNKYGCGPSDLEGFVSFLRRLKGVDVSVLLREKLNKGTKISLRSTGGAGSVDVQAIAAHFGGGGHKSAAGAETDLGIDKAEAAVLEVLLPVLEGNSLPTPSPRR